MMTKSSLINEIPIKRLLEFLEQDEGGVLFTIKVKPASSKERLFLSNNDQLTLTVRARAIENAANERVIELIAELFSLPKSKVQIPSGHRSRIKRIMLCDQQINEVEGLLKTK